MSENTNTERDYPELPNFDSADEPIWEAIFSWKTAQTGADAHRKSLAVEAAIISTLRAYVDADRKARASLSLPAAEQEPVATVFTMEALAPGGGVKYHATIHKPVPAGTKLYTAPQPAVAAGWMPIETAPRGEKHRDGCNTYGEYIWAWHPGAIAPYRARWWQHDSGQSNFLADSGWAGMPTLWMPLPLHPAPSTEGESRGTQ